MVDALRPVTDKPLDCHLMIVEPELRVADFAKVWAEGAALLSRRASVVGKGRGCLHLLAASSASWSACWDQAGELSSTGCAALSASCLSVRACGSS